MVAFELDGQAPRTAGPRTGVPRREPAGTQSRSRAQRPFIGVDQITAKRLDSCGPQWSLLTS